MDTEGTLVTQSQGSSAMLECELPSERKDTLHNLFWTDLYFPGLSVTLQSCHVNTSILKISEGCVFINILT